MKLLIEIKIRDVPGNTVYNCDDEKEEEYVIEFCGNCLCRVRGA